MSLQYRHDLIRKLLYRGEFAKFPHPFKDLPPELQKEIRNEILNSYEFTIMPDGENYDRRVEKPNKPFYLKAGSVELERDDDDSAVNFKNDMLIVLNDEDSKKNVKVNIGQVINTILEKMKHHLLHAIRNHPVNVHLPKQWRYEFTIPVKDLRYHFSLRLNAKEPFTILRSYFEKAIFELGLCKITLITENFSDNISDITD